MSILLRVDGYMSPFGMLFLRYLWYALMDFHQTWGREELIRFLGRKVGGSLLSCGDIIIIVIIIMFLFQRLSIALQRGNAVAFRGTFNTE